MAFSFQQAYEAAADGATIQVPPGVAATDDVGRDSVTIFGSGTKRITFVAQDPTKIITHDCIVFTMNAKNVTLKGPGWWLHDVRIGEGGDTVRYASGVVLDGIHMDGIEVVGAEAAIRNCEIGPNVLGYAVGSGQPASTCLDPNGPAYEAFYASRGSERTHGFQPYFHNNSGGIVPSVVFEDNYIHDIQTLDAVGLHTGGGIVWNGGNPLIMRRNRYERCSVLGIIFRNQDGVIFEDNVMAGPVEPWSNVGRYNIVEAGDFAKEIVLRDDPGGQTLARDWQFRRNKFCHGTRSDLLTQNCVFDSNDLGRADAPWTGAAYTNNTNAGTGCSGVAPPPPPPPPPPTTGWTVCAQEAERCSFSGQKEVRYGANDVFTAPRVFTDGVECSNAVFGDPVFGVQKHCEVRDVTTPSDPPPAKLVLREKLPRASKTITIVWDKPLDADLAGYNFYKNGSKVATVNDATLVSRGFRTYGPGAYRFGVEPFDKAGQKTLSEITITR